MASVAVVSASKAVVLASEAPVLISKTLVLVSEIVVSAFGMALRVALNVEKSVEYN